MKKFKKIGLGIVAVVALLPTLFSLLPASQVSAASTPSYPQSFWDNASYTIPAGDTSTINVSNGPTRVEFQKAAGSIYDVAPLNSASIPGFCSGSTQNYIQLNSTDFSKATLSGNLHVQYSVTTTDQQGHSQTDCTTYTKQVSVTNLSANGTNGTCTYAACSNNDIKNSLTTFQFGSNPATITGTFANGKSVPFTDGDTSDTTHTYSAPKGNFCSGGGQLGSITIKDSDYQKILSSKENSVPGVLDVDWYNASNKNCNDYSPGNTAPIDIDTTAYVSSMAAGASCSPPGATQGNLICGGTDGGSCTSQGCVWAAAATADTTSNGDSCSLKSNGATLAWIMCPTLEMMDALATNLMGLFENQLNFCVDHGGVTCAASPDNNVQKGDYCAGGSDCSNGVCQKTGGTCTEGSSLGSGQDEVKTAWTAIKDLASAVIVIVLLIMVFSQAVGSGPFEAYTVRKMLPRLVAAVILIQISWYLCAFIVDIFNDIGNGLADLLYAPFGGPSQLDFGSLLANANIGTGSGFFISYIGGVAAIALGVAFLPTVIFGALVGVLTLLAGLAVLMFRKILIILLIMLSPLAIVAWVLPGQGVQSLWKKWQDNFTKVLTMFPLVVAIIAAGRIFAYVVGSTKNGTFLNFWFVIAGYFLPLFILPRAYKWGGSILSAAGGQITSLQNNAQRAAKEPLKNFVREKTTDKWANKYSDVEKGRLSRTWQSLKGGRVIPTRASKAKMLFRGQQWSSTMAERNDALLNNFVRNAQEKGISAEELQKWNNKARQAQIKSGVKPENVQDMFSPGDLKNGIRPNAVGSGKKASQILAMMAEEKGDAELKKAVGRYHVRSKSLLEMADPYFVFPQKQKYYDPATKQIKEKMVMAPYWDYRPLIDQAFKDNAVWGELGSMRPDLTPNNVPRGGARYAKILARAGLRRGRDVNAEEFDVGADMIAANPVEGRYEREFKDAATGEMRNRPYLMQKMQALDEDTKGIIQKGGNTLLTFANEITHWADKGYYGEGPSSLPSEVFAEQIVKSASTESGLHSIANLQSTPAHVKAIDAALKASGITQFIGADGEAHELNVDELFEVNEKAFARMHAEGGYTPHESELVRSGTPPPTAPADDGGDHGYRPLQQESSFMEMPEGGERARTHSPVSRPTSPSEFEDTEYGAPRYDPTARPSEHVSSAASGAPAPAGTSTVETRTTERVVREVSPTVSSTAATAGHTAAATTETPPVVQVDLGSAGAQFDRLARAADAMNEAAFHMRRTAATQERAARRIEGLQPDGTMNVSHDDENDGNQGNTPGQNT